MSALRSLQDTLAAEHAAIFVLGAFGGAVSATAAPEEHALLASRHRAHLARREFLTTTVRGMGEVPVAAAPAYVLPDDLSSASAARTGASTVERRCAEEYATLVASTTDELRAWAVATLGDSALALLAWGEEPEPFPGAPELPEP